MSHQTVLISGAGIAGPTLAYWLARHGFRPTVVERSGALRSSGSPVDVRGPAVEVAERMGVMERVRAAGTGVSVLSFVNGAGRRVGRINMRALQGAAGDREVELSRADLGSILYEASRDDAEYLFDNSITVMNEDEGGIDVDFEQGASRRFDLVIGSDGLHSAVRRLGFGPEPQFVQHMGIYIATLPLTGTTERRDELLIYNMPSRMATIHPAGGRPLAAFIFRHAPVPGFDYRDIGQHKRILATAYADAGWRVPELIEQMRAANDLYFDAVSKVSVDKWSRGRIALLGDAASCVSLFGDGSSSAVAGAYCLAEELAASPFDHQSAFERYEARHRLLVAPKQRGMEQAAALLIPRTATGIVARNLATRLWPVAAAVGQLGRALAGRRAFG